ncbi:S8 family serine peptidase [Pelagicoccus mobilis]|uniref:S8 family serine peptidase n=1 Tax=Pelagicoccus mobilis TaxID=415221 RepID=A0A934RUK5_9BACT|nr:S8 family serine peptidase [Pelagicoccus mobilis]MBK1875399.1 S8 family serine peptidase [Pelagicoccus mobilis]
MKTAGIAKIGLILLLVGVGFWWAIDDREKVEGGEKTRLAHGAQVEEMLFEETLALDSIVVSVTFEEASTIPALELNGWTERYPNGEIAESRLKSLGGGRFRLQHLLETGSESIPWVLWEEKLVREPSGDFSHFGSVAHMGNVFLIDAREELVPASALDAFVSEFGLFVERRSRVADYVCLGFSDPKLGKLETMVDAFQDQFPGALVEFDTLSYPSSTPNDWDGSRMWGLDTIRARDAWTFEKGSSDTDVVIAIIDTGMQRNHFDIVDNLFINPNDSTINAQDNDGNGLVDDVSGWDFYNDDSEPNDDDGHGTHVGGIAGAKGNNGSGAVGVNWGVKLLPLKVGDAEGLRTSSINDALAYVRRLKNAGINIVATNNSYGSGGANTSTRNEISLHEELGILFVAAAGNDGRNMDIALDARGFPAGYTLDNIISVANSRQDDSLNGSSNYGTTSVDLSAPGSEIYAPYPDNSYAFLSGTSMASPMVAGAVGLLAQAEPDLTASQIKSRLLDTGDPVPSQLMSTVSGRRLNLLAALKPEMSGHEISVSNVSDFVVLFDDLEGDAEFQVAAHDDARVTASVVFGPGVGRIEPLGNRVFRFVPTGFGQAKVRFVSSLLGVSKSIEKTIVVGDKSPVSDGLIHHFSFDGSGAVVEDLAGQSDGTVVGATRENSEFGRSMRFDSVSENVSFNGQFSELVTITALIRSDRMTASPHPRIVNMPFYYLYISSGSGPNVPDGNRETLKFYSDFTEFGVWNAPPTSIRDGQWYFVAATYDSKSVLNTPKLFINGERLIARMQQEPKGTINQSAALSYLGNNGEGARAFDGLMADIRIYDRELSPIEISDLGASLVQDKWDSVELLGPHIVGLGAVSDFTSVDNSDLGLPVTARWHVAGDSDYEIVSENGSEGRIKFNEAGRFDLVAQVSDGVATRVFVKQVDVSDGEVTSGRYHGTTESGGIVWLEVEEGLETGFVSIFDPDTGYYRIREAVTIDDSGSFRSLEGSVGRISGTALSGLVGVVPGYGIEFSGQFQTSPSSETLFAGQYLGGVLGRGGDAIDLEILNDGRAYLLRTGPFADIAWGAIDDEEGRLSVTSARGLEVSLEVSLEGDSVAGDWGVERFFMKTKGVVSEGVLMAGLAGGQPAGSGLSGLYSEFVSPGQEASGNLVGGGFAGVGSEFEGGGPLVLLAADGKAYQVIAAADQDIAEAIGETIETFEVDLAVAEIDAVRIQAPVSEATVSAVAFSVTGAEPLEVLLRGIVPSFNLEEGIDPAIKLYGFSETGIAELSSNDDWAEGMLFTGINESSQGAFLGLVQSFEELGLPELDLLSSDAALRVWLEPGRYLLVVEGTDSGDGAGLIELFRL